MKSEDIKKLIPLYLENELEVNECQIVKDAMARDPQLKAYADELVASWDILGEIEEINPTPDYVSEFWTRVSSDKSGSQNLIAMIFKYLYNRRVAPVFAGICVILLVSIIGIRGYILTDNPRLQELSQLSMDEIDILENIELVENLDIIEDMDFFEDLDVINEMEDSELLYAT